MGTVYRGAGRPVIAQQGATLALTDWGDFFTQESGNEHIDRHAVQWERETGPGSWEVIPPFGPTFKRTRWDAHLDSEVPFNAHLKLGRENVGRRFRAQTWGGYGPSRDGGVDWVEWGNSDGSHSNDDVPSERSYSEVLTVQPFGQPPPTDRPTATFTRNTMVNLAKAWEHGQPNPTPLARITVAREILELKDDRWNAVREGVRALLDTGSE